MNDTRLTAILYAAVAILVSVTPAVWMVYAFIYGNSVGAIAAGLFASAIIVGTIDRLQ